jgi:hypothetical protein
MSLVNYTYGRLRHQRESSLPIYADSLSRLEVPIAVSWHGDYGYIYSVVHIVQTLDSTVDIPGRRFRLSHSKYLVYQTSNRS